MPLPTYFGIVFMDCSISAPIRLFSSVQVSVSLTEATVLFWDVRLSAKSLQSCLILCDPVDLACQVSLSKGFSWQEYWSG